MKLAGDLAASFYIERCCVEVKRPISTSRPFQSQLSLQPAIFRLKERLPEFATTLEAIVPSQASLKAIDFLVSGTKRARKIVVPGEDRRSVPRFPDRLVMQIIP